MLVRDRCSTAAATIGRVCFDWDLVWEDLAQEGGRAREVSGLLLELLGGVVGLGEGACAGEGKWGGKGLAGAGGGLGGGGGGGGAFGGDGD